MKQNQKRIITAVVILISFWFVLNWTGLFRYYKLPTSANEPNYFPGDWIYVSSFSEPDLLDMVCFENDKGEVFMYRLCGLPGDKVEIRDGRLFVNGKNKDKSLELKKLYQINDSDFVKLSAIDIPYESLPFDTTAHFVILHTSDSKNIPSATISDPFQTKGRLHKSFSGSWSVTNFGPVTVPQGKVFALGDNRNNAVDSRFRGFFDEDDIVGTVLN